MKYASVVLALLAAAMSARARHVMDINMGWDYAPDGWSGPAHKVDLPHDFQMEMTWSKDADAARGFKPMGAARYRNAFATSPSWTGERVFLDFEGIMCVGDVFVNGEKAASPDYGYLGFEADVTRLLRPSGGTNEVEVWASTGRANGSRWYTGGGIVRPVHVKTRPVRSIARHGIFVTTPEVSSTEATVRVQVELDGFTGCTNDVTAEVVVRDGAGAVRGSASCKVPCRDYRRRVTFTFPDMKLSEPALWDVDSPSLYAAEVRLASDGKVVDADSARFGIRKVEFSPEFGFRLNGRKVFLKGMSNHADYGALGAAAFPRAIERGLRRMKEFGFNAVRCSHNPYSEAFYDLADEIGILVVDEFTDKWSRGEPLWMGRRLFLEIWPGLMTEWIRRDRNHPCVIMWSLGNELQHSEACAGYETGDWGVTTYRMMDVFVKNLDPTRKTTVGLYPARAGGVCPGDPRYWRRPLRPPELSDATDVASFNYVHRDYPEYLRWNPNLVIFQSEASTSEWLEPYFGMDRDRTVGVSWWGAVEYWGESNRWPKKGWNYSFFSHALEPRPQAYMARSALLQDVPLTRIGVMVGAGESLLWNDVRSGQKVLRESWSAEGDAERDVYVFSNAGEVELLLNGKSLGRRRTRQNAAEWKSVAYEPGRLEARGDNGSSFAVETAGDAVALRLEEESPGDWRADGQDLKYVRVYAVDAAGRRVVDATPRLRVSVRGAASLLALDDDDHFTGALFNVGEKRMKEGFLLAVLRASENPGSVEMAIESDDIPGQTMNLSTQPKAGK